MSDAVKKLELTEIQIKIITELVKTSLQEDLLLLRQATEKKDADYMFTLMVVSNEERKIIEALEA